MSKYSDIDVGKAEAGLDHREEALIGMEVVVLVPVQAGETQSGGDDENEDERQLGSLGPNRVAQPAPPRRRGRCNRRLDHGIWPPEGTK